MEPIRKTYTSQTRPIHRCMTAGLCLISLLLSGCATMPPGPPPMITINTIPAGADVSVQGNYVGQSPVSIPMPVAMVDMGGYNQGVVGRADHPLQIEVQMTGYETKTVAFGDFHAPQDKVVQDVLSWNMVTKTQPGYYLFPNQITIKLSPR